MILWGFNYYHYFLATEMPCWLGSFPSLSLSLSLSVSLSPSLSLCLPLSLSLSLSLCTAGHHICQPLKKLQCVGVQRASEGENPPHRLR